MKKTRYLEDFQVGERWQSRPVSLSAEEIIAFGRVNDPQEIAEMLGTKSEAK